MVPTRRQKLSAKYFAAQRARLESARAVQVEIVKGHVVRDFHVRFGSAAHSPALDEPHRGRTARDFFEDVPPIWRYQPQTSAPESVGPRFLLGSAAIIELQQWGHRSLDGRLTP